MARKIGQSRVWRGWVINRDGPRDAPWTAWKSGVIRRNADTLEGLKRLCRHYDSGESD